MPGNVLDGVPEQLGVVDAQRSDAADLGQADDVGRVVLAADADLRYKDTTHKQDFRKGTFFHLKIEIFLATSSQADQWDVVISAYCCGV